MIDVPDPILLDHRLYLAQYYSVEQYAQFSSITLKHLPANLNIINYYNTREIDQRTYYHHFQMVEI